MRYVWAAVLVATLAGCDRPRPFAAFEPVRAHACACKDVTCAEDAERALAEAIVKRRGLDDAMARMFRAPIIDDARACISAAWRASQPPDLFSAESEVPPGRSPPSTCTDAYAVAHRILACDRTPVAHRTFVAQEFLLLRSVLDGQSAEEMTELQIYEHCLRLIMLTMRIEDCR